MALINWTESLSVKIKSIDDQHKVLIGLINELHDSMRAGKGKEAVGKIIDELVDYTRYHFGYEESIFAKIGYVESAAHKRSHIALTDKVVDLQKKFKEGSLSITIETMSFLKTWLSDHIMGTDQKYTGSFISKGIS